MKQYESNNIRVPRFSEANGFYTTKERSELMSKIRSRETKPEVILRKILWALGLHYRKNVKSIVGKPDIVLRKYKLIIFIDGSFWHGYNWQEKKNKIKNNRDFWIPKIERNIQRDKEVNAQLIELGFKVIRFWDHQIKDELNYCINTILDHITNFENEEYWGNDQ